MSPKTSDSLYGVPRPSKKPIQTSTSLAFSSQLSSLITSTPPTTRTNAARPRPSKTRKDDIFTSHNKGTKRRAEADISTQKHNVDIGVVDGDTLHRSKRKMEEKARLYAAMKRGDYIPPSHGTVGEERGSLVDFDRKWAEDESKGKDDGDYETSSGDDDGPSEAGDQEVVEFTDEFGRLRRGTKAEAAREERRRKAKEHAEEELAAMSALPERPSNLIYGDTIQSEAFNPDETLAQKIAELAQKRDRSATPPPEVHYDANKEVRSKGVGFYQFSGASEERKKEMKELERERLETERRRKEREEMKKRRKAEIEERRREVGKKKEERMAEMWLEGLDGELDMGKATDDK